jgi:hypothetical protein
MLAFRADPHLRGESRRWHSVGLKGRLDMRLCRVPLIQPLSNSDWVRELSELYQFLP